MAGFIGRVLQYTDITRNGITVPAVKVALHVGENVIAEMYAPSGDDSPPLIDDLIYLAKNSATGGYTAIGGIDQGNAPEAAPAEKRLYARDSTGAIRLAMWLYNDGKISITNDTQELISVLSDLIQHLIDARVITSLGPQPFLASTVTLLTSDKTKLDTFKK